MSTSIADDFLKQKQLFQLGDLPTETPHPKTVHLSELANQDLDRALQVLREIDLEALRKILTLKAELKPIFEAVAGTLDKGHRIYLVGCGATGRLSLSLEFLWRRQHPQSEQVFSLMAGGDVALVHSLEGFEDFPEYGARHLRQLGFTENDLLIATTEGGETPYVIGAVEEAAATSRRKPLFLYCNTPQILIDKVERSRRVLTNPGIHCQALDTGPMGLTGSTRMQASTVLMLVVGLALEYGGDVDAASGLSKSGVDAAFLALEKWIHHLENTPVTPLRPFVIHEAETYQAGGYTMYAVDEMAITAFTDTTERAPTFNLAPFDNPKELSDRRSLTYITLPSTGNALEAWRKLLARDPRPLHWPEVHPKTSADYLLSFDFSRGAQDFRRQILSAGEQRLFTIDSNADELRFRFHTLEARVPLSGQNALFDHLTLKMLLNMHSTLVFGRLNRFEGNLMTWLYPSNGKLVDRAARYTQILLKRAGHTQFSYDEIVRAQFAVKADLSPKESIVHRTIARLLSGQTRRPEPHGPR